MARRFSIAGHAYAHRGLWSPGGLPENSRAAFLAAAGAGFGVELDVRPAADGIPVVFHDPLLDRMTDASGLVCQYPAHELSSLHLAGSTLGISTLEQVLQDWPPAMPILVELKIDGATEPAAFAAEVARQVCAHDGAAACMSFSAEAVEALPGDLMRGLLVAPRSMSGPDRFEEAIAASRRLRVDYVALWHDDADAAPTGTDLAVWTVKSAAEAAALPARALGMIFEHFTPSLAER